MSNSRDLYRDGHGFRDVPVAKAKPGWPSKWRHADGKINLISARLDGFLVEVFDDTQQGGGAATNEFYHLVQDKTVMFAALYGSDGRIINNFYRRVNDPPRPRASFAAGQVDR